MPSDKEYLAEAGIDAETGGAVNEAPATVSTTENAESAPAVETAQAPAKPVEMFEIGGQKYPIDTKFKLTHGGKILEVPYSNMANTYRQWQHLQDKWSNDYKPKIDDYEKNLPEYQKAKQFYDRFGHLQEWSEKNPDQWASLFEHWKNRDKHLLAAQVGAPEAEGVNVNPLVNEIAELKKQIAEDREKYGKYIERFDTDVKTKQEQQDLEFVKGEIKTFQTDYPEINLDERDPDGNALWAKIVEFGLQKGYTEFEPAALVYLKQRLADVYATRARTEVRGSVKQDRMNGIVKRSATPFNQGQGPAVKQADNLRKKSYGDLAQEAKAELMALSGT